MPDWKSARFAFAWLLPLAVAAGAWISPWAAWGALLGQQILLALAERVPALQHSPPPTPQTRWHRAFLWLHLPIQASLLALGLWLVVTRSLGPWEVAALALAVGGVCGTQGITYAHELGHSKSRADRVLAWVLMSSVNYAHFMVEHFRGHHVRVATAADPASARRGEGLWRFLPRTLAGSWRSAWRLEARRLQQRRRGWHRSPLAWAVAAQAAWLAALAAALGPLALLFWIVQSAHAVFLLEAINYIEHYGLQRRVVGGRPEPFGVGHAWNADAVLTNSMIANLQRHSDHHMHAWKPYAELAALPGPQLPTGYAGCLFLASVPTLWIGVMERRLSKLAGA